MFSRCAARLIRLASFAQPFLQFGPRADKGLVGEVYTRVRVQYVAAERQQTAFCQVLTRLFNQVGIISGDTEFVDRLLAGGCPPHSFAELNQAQKELRFTGVVAGAVLRLVRNLVAWRRSLDIPGWFSMRSIERPDVRAVKRLVPRLRGDARRPFRVTVFDRRQLADGTKSGCHCRTFPARTRSALQSTE